MIQELKIFIQKCQRNGRINLRQLSTERIFGFNKHYQTKTDCTYKLPLAIMWHKNKNKTFI